MTRLWRWLKWSALALLLCIIGLVSPVLYVETMCRSSATPAPYTALIAPEHHRAETRTLMTYPEWHIVHAYQDYGEVLRTGDPHDYSFLRGIAGYWRSLCQLSRAAGEHGEIDGATKQLVYVIGVSFTAEFLLKALYEETVGRAFTMLRGPARSALDEISAQQAADYAVFLQQVPWYRWPFAEDAEALRAHDPNGLRDHERRIALGIEFGAKAAYARVIAQAVSQVGPDELTLRMIVAGADAEALSSNDAIRVIALREAGLEIETPRYRALTLLLQEMAADGVDFVEIAGNDDILFSALSDQPDHPDALMSLPRQGFGDHRHLFVVDVAGLADRLRGLDPEGLTLEHIHDY